LLGAIGRYIRQHHVALLALFVALGGTALALDRNGVKSRHIAPGEVKLSDTNDRLRLKCPGGTRYFEGGCIERSARADAIFTNARDDCLDENRRLPSATELRLFRHERGVTLADQPGPVGEWSSDTDVDGSPVATVIADAVNSELNDAWNNPHGYRCVARAKR